jgi:zinc protease
MRPARRGLAAAAVFAAASLAGFAPCPAQDLRFDIVSDRLDNGLEVMVIEDHTVPAITYYTFFRVGSRNERPGRTGISHLFEHMMFNGAKKYGPGEFDRALESRGGTSNAFTAEDVTGYFESFPSDAFELVVDMEADRMAALQISAEGLDKERGVVQEERRLRVDNDIQGAMLESLNALAYLAHPYSWPVVGWMPDLEAITVDDCREYFRIHYAPNNAFIVIAGDVAPERAKALVRKAFSGIPRQTLPPPVVANEPAQAGERRAILRKAAQAPSIAVAWHVGGTATGGADTDALDLVETLLTGGESSRLERVLVRDRQLASWVLTSNLYRVDPSLFLAMAEARPGVAIADLESALHEEIGRLVREGPGARELEKARNVRTMTLLRNLKTSDGKAQQVGVHAIYFGSPARLFQTPQRLAAVDAEAIRRVAGRVFRPENRTVVTLLPGEPEPGDGSGPGEDGPGKQEPQPAGAQAGGRR